ncbi:LacI family DNA-binding transcriptional regulator [Arcticibacter sp.]|uniref:LacI family DNA-binding transcriptional regulator n=1 Tax=Arcticibacter sp. TaxID=1872630 RepID=UPI0038907FDD
MKSRETTIYDIAKRLNIAPSTVSRGLKGHRTVSLETQKKIAKTASEMGYQMNAFAVGLRTRRTNTIGVIIPRLNSNFVSNVLAGIEKVTNHHGFNLIITQSLESREKEIRNVATMFANRVDGLLMSLSGDTKDINHIEPFFKKHIPVLFFDRVPTSSTSSVCIDNENAAYTITRHLISNGAKRIVHIGGSHDINVYSDRFRGFLRAITESGHSINDNLLILSDLDENTGEKHADNIMNLKADAIFAANDIAAVSCMNALKKRNMKVPGDMLIAGFNNDIISRNVTPQLSTIHYPGLEMGELVAQKMIDHLLNDIAIEANTTTILESKLIVRESSGG